MTPTVLVHGSHFEDPRSRGTNRYVVVYPHLCLIAVGWWGGHKREHSFVLHRISKGAESSLGGSGYQSMCWVQCGGRTNGESSVL